MTLWIAIAVLVAISTAGLVAVSPSGANATPMPRAVDVALSRAIHRSAGTRVRVDVLENRVRAALRHAQSVLEGRVHRTLVLPWTAAFANFPTRSDEVFGSAEMVPVDAAGEHATSGPAASCLFKFNLPFYRSNPQYTSQHFLAYTATHEMWHCFQVALTDADAGGHGHWITEGQAEWVAQTIAPVSGAPVTHIWNEWLNNGSAALLDRSYDALGFYAVLEHAGIDPFTVLDPMLRAPTDEDAFTVAVGSRGPSFSVTIGQAVTRLPELGDAWQSTGPSITNARYTHTLDVHPSHPVHANRSVPGHAGVGYELHLQGDVLHVRTNAPFGAIAFAGGNHSRFTEPLDQEFCLRHDGCPCAHGHEPGGQPLAQGERGTGALALGAGADEVSTHTVLQSFDLGDYCRAHPPDACFPGTYKPTSTPVLSEQLQHEFSSIPGFQGISGGVLGRKIEFGGGGQWTATDDGSDPPTGHGVLEGSIPFDTKIPVVSSSSGTYTTTAGNHITFTTSTYRYAQNPPRMTISVGEYDIPVPFPAEAVRGLGTFNSSGTYQCSGSNLTLKLENSTITMTRAT